MPGGDACLLDSNILLRINKSDDPQACRDQPCALCAGQAGARICYTSQTIGECCPEIPPCIRKTPAAAVRKRAYRY